MKSLITLLLLCASLPLAHASVQTLPPFQDITQRDADGNGLYSSVGIDGNSIILATYVQNGTRATLLRQGAGGRWAVSRVLSDVTLPGDERDIDVAMKNGIAAMRISTRRILIFERVNNDWTQTDALDNPNYTGGVAVSGARWPRPRATSRRTRRQGDGASRGASTRSSPGVTGRMTWTSTTRLP